MNLSFRVMLLPRNEEVEYYIYYIQWWYRVLHGTKLLEELIVDSWWW